MNESAMQALLEQLSFSQKEARIYLALSTCGDMGAGELASVVRTYRPNVYDSLRQLEERGLVHSYLMNGSRLYKAAPPDVLGDSIEQKLSIVRNLKQAIEKSKPERKEVQVAIYTGNMALRAVFREYVETLASTRTVGLLMGVDERAFMAANRTVMERFFEQMKELRLRERVLVAEGEKYLPAPKETTTYRGLPRAYFDSTTAFQVYGGTVNIIVFSDPLHVLAIRSPRIADAYRKKFGLLWKHSKPIKR